MNQKSNGGEDYKKSLKWAIYLTSIFFVVEVIGGFLSGSLALLSDAGHMLRDVFALAVSLSALKISRRLPSKRKTFGYHRMEIFATFLNGIFLVAMGILILYEAFQRIGSPHPIQSTTMLIVALIGFGVNLYIAFRLHGSRDLNVKSAFLHVVTDAAFSLGVIAAAFLIYLTGQTIFDPILSAVISLVIVFSAFKVIKDSTMILLEFAPMDVDFDQVIQDIQSIEGVQGVHNVHLWALCSNINIIDAHVYTRINDMREIERMKAEIKKRLEKYNIKQATLEFECEECVLPDEVAGIKH
jgi:cobalt-zinc-cadmium efflux system protein